MIKQLTILLGLSAGLILILINIDFPLGGELELSEQGIVSKIEASQTAYFKDNGKYEQGFKTDNWKEKLGLNEDSPFEITIHIYKAPGENYGYRTILENDEIKKSVGYGVEASMHTWEIIKIATTTATTTP